MLELDNHVSFKYDCEICNFIPKEPVIEIKSPGTCSRFLNQHDEDSMYICDHIGKKQVL